MENKIPPKTEVLLDEEARLIKERRSVMDKVANEIRFILLRENMTWGEWGEVVERFSRRIGTIVANKKIQND